MPPPLLLRLPARNSLRFCPAAAAALLGFPRREPGPGGWGCSPELRVRGTIQAEAGGHASGDGGPAPPWPSRRCALAGRSYGSCLDARVVAPSDVVLARATSGAETCGAERALSTFEKQPVEPLSPITEQLTRVATV